MRPYLIFSDLDGTLLDHHDYSFESASAALALISKLEIPLILNSSKTEVEIRAIRKNLNNNDPFVVENGAVFYIPGGVFPGFSKPLTEISFAPDYETIVKILRKLRKQYRYAFTGFSDLSIHDVETITGLSADQADMAKRRSGSEPLLWEESERRLKSFQRDIEHYGLKLIQGGRFFHVMGIRADKANAMSWLVAQYRNTYQADFKTIALGDSENDKKMLENSDIAAVIRSNSGTSLAINKDATDVIYTKQTAPQGWQEAMDVIFQRLKIGF